MNDWYGHLQEILPPHFLHLACHVSNLHFFLIHISEKNQLVKMYQFYHKLYHVHHRTPQITRVSERRKRVVSHRLEIRGTGISRWGWELTVEMEGMGTGT